MFGREFTAIAATGRDEFVSVWGGGLGHGDAGFLGNFYLSIVETVAVVIVINGLSGGKTW
jgi:hypothetical protein